MPAPHLERIKSNHTLVFSLFNCVFLLCFSLLNVTSIFSSTKNSFYHFHLWAIFFWVEIKVNPGAFQENPSTVHFHRRLTNILTSPSFEAPLEKKNIYIAQNTKQGKTVKDQTLQLIWVIMQGLRWWLAILQYLLEEHRFVREYEGSSVVWRTWLLSHFSFSFFFPLYPDQANLCFTASVVFPVTPKHVC